MADLNDIQAAGSTKLVGSDASGQEGVPVQSTAQGGLHMNLRDVSGVEAGTNTNPLKTTSGQDLVIATLTTSTPLAGAAVFNPAFVDLSLINGGEITINVFANVASAALGFQIQWSVDGTNADHVESYTIPAMTAGQGKTFTQRKVARYLKVVYTNGAGAQATFRLTTILNATTAKPSSHRIGNSIDDENDGQLVKANNTGRRADGTHSNIKATNNDDLNVADILDNGGVNGIISVSTSAVPVRVGGSNLANRKRLTFMNNGTATLFWGYSSGVTTANGFPIFRNQPVSDAWGPNTTIWIIAASGTHPVPVNEAA